MFKNYFKIAYRNLTRQKGYTFINIFGLAVGLTCCLLIVFYVLDELSYDRFHTKADRIYRVTMDLKYNDAEMNLAVVGTPVAPTMVQEFPEVEKAVRFARQGSKMIKYGEKTLKEEKLVYADSSLFQIFDLPLVQGDPQTALREPNTVLVSETAANRYFGDEDPVGKVVRVDDFADYKVIGVYRDIPRNSHFQANMIGAYKTLEQNNGLPYVWLNMNHPTYVLLREGTDPKVLEAKLPGLVERYVAKEFEQFMNTSLEQFEAGGNRAAFGLQPLTSIHLHSDLSGEFEPNGDIKYVYIFSAIALIILLIACINFMNLSTARSANRAKEVGVRKVVGSGRKQLIGQFLAESVLLTVLAFGISLVLVELALPYFNDLAGKEVEVSYFSQWYLLPAVVAVVVAVGLLAGTYPAFYLSAFEPVKVLKGRLAAGTRGSWVRSGLVVFQFCISIILLIGTWVITDQLKYIQSKKVGFDKEQVVVLHDTNPLNDKATAFKEEMLNLPQVTNATVSGFLPAGQTNSTVTAIFAGRNFSRDEGRTMNLFFVDEDYIPTFGMEMATGRNFSKEFSTDTAAVILNESAALSFGWAEDPLGKEISTFGNGLNDVVTYRVIGVVKDFNFTSLREKVKPMIMLNRPSKGNISFKVNTADMPGFLQTLEAKWSEFAPGQPFSYSFLDERFDGMYKSEQRIRGIFGVFSGLAIFIACLGLFGLATFIAEQRTKEIGIRKVLGASVPNLVGLLSRDFAKLVAIAFVVAAPVAWYLMKEWLQDFEYRVTLGWQTFAIAGLLALLIALLTVSFQAIKAALTNPVKSLKTE